GPAGLWAVVSAGRAVVSAFPPARGWAVAGLSAPAPAAAGPPSPRWGAFLAAAPGFAAGFFGLAPRAVLALAPPPRLLLAV
ncbi:polyketide synthase, partial [Mycobacterium tuberculosis]|uniref:beta-ketoacyl synthase N-terminal-like domain-containing protein n=1 Tax=Mycobacterium tuberculosis TaxID=1773 RepID=UPI000E39C20A